MQTTTYINADFLNMEELAVALYKRTTFASILKKYMLEHVIGETIDLKNLNGEVQTYPLVQKGVKYFSRQEDVYINKRFVKSFIKRHFDALVELGVPVENLYYAQGLIHEISYQTIEQSNLVKLWNVSSKVHNNSKIVPYITHYIKTHYLTETFPSKDPETGKEREEQMFVFVKPPQGKNGVGIKKEAVPYFLKRYKAHLKTIAEKFENEFTYTSLRAFASYLGKNNNEAKLNAFIKEHMDEKFTIFNEDDTIEELPIAEMLMSKCGNSTLCIIKKAIPAFIQKYQKELIELGFPGVEALLNNFEKVGDRKNFLSMTNLARRLFKKETFAPLLTQGADEIFIHDKIEEVDEKTGKITTRPLFRARFFRKVIYFISEKDVPIFVRRHANWLIQQGVLPSVVEHYSQNKEIVHRTKEMISFRDLTLFLKKHQFALIPLIEEIKNNHLNDTYIVDEATKKEEPVFILAKTVKGFLHHFRNQKALFAFLRNNKDLLERHGFCSQKIDAITGDKKAIDYSDDYIFIPQLQAELRLVQPGVSEFIRQNYLNETIQEKNADGALIERPIFVFVKSKSVGIGNYAIHRDDLPLFATRHQQELKIKKGVIEALNTHQPILQRLDSQLPFTDFAYFLGNKTRYASTMLSKLVKEKYFYETTLVQTPTGPQEKQIFQYAYHPQGGVVTLYVHTDCIPNFVAKHKEELLAIGYREDRLAAAVREVQTNPRFYEKIICQNKILNSKRRQTMIEKRLQKGRQKS